MNGSAALLAVLSVVGYVLLRHCWHWTKFRWDTIEWQQNVFESTAVGIALFGICRIAAPLIHRVQSALGLDPTAVPRYLQSHLALPFAGSVVEALLLGLALTGLANLWLTREKAQAHALTHHGGSLRGLLLEAHLAKRAVMLTLNTRKVYVGWVFTLPLLKRPTYVVLFPTLSGYRRADDLAVRWTTDYFPAYLDIMMRLQAGERLQSGPEHFQLVLPLESVTSATFFDDEVYNRHFAKRKAT